MGGYGSGWHRGARQTVDDALSYTLSGIRPYLRLAEEAQADGYLGVATRGNITWSRGGQQTAKVGFTLDVDSQTALGAWSGITLVLDYAVGGEPVRVRVPLDTTAVYRTGVRYWMRCPRCSRRCGALHIPGGALRFACRTCHDLTYQSCQESRQFDSLYRSLGLQMGTDPKHIKRLLNRRLNG